MTTKRIMLIVLSVLLVLMVILMSMVLSRAGGLLSAVIGPRPSPTTPSSDPTASVGTSEPNDSIPSTPSESAGS